jgi:hypothetical protein
MLDSKPKLSNTAHLALEGAAYCAVWFSHKKMARELVWLENNTFAAWGCSACAWIVPNPGPTVSGKPPERVTDAVDKHECAKFPRVPESR